MQCAFSSIIHHHLSVKQEGSGLTTDQDRKGECDASYHEVSPDERLRLVDARSSSAQQRR
jgi:hypothetical protein